MEPINSIERSAKRIAAGLMRKAYIKVADEKDLIYDLVQLRVLDMKEIAEADIEGVSTTMAILKHQTKLCSACPRGEERVALNWIFAGDDQTTCPNCDSGNPFCVKCSDENSAECRKCAREKHKKDKTRKSKAKNKTRSRSRSRSRKSEASK